MRDEAGECLDYDALPVFLSRNLALKLTPTKYPNILADESEIKFCSRFSLLNLNVRGSRSRPRCPELTWDHDRFLMMGWNERASLFEDLVDLDWVSLDLGD